jgi:hypothetical protein
LKEKDFQLAEVSTLCNDLRDGIKWQDESAVLSLDFLLDRFWTKSVQKNRARWMKRAHIIEGQPYLELKDAMDLFLSKNCTFGFLSRFENMLKIILKGSFFGDISHIRL